MIPQTSPKATIDEDRTRIDAAIARVLDSGRYIQGPEVESFEQAFAAYSETAHGIGVATGTDAVEIGLRALGVGPGDRVATVSHTAVATIAAIRAIGAAPLWVDIDESGFVMDVGHLRQVVTAAKSEPNGGRLKAVVAVHLYGNMVPIAPLLAVCREFGLKLLEDCAQAHGASHSGGRAGSFGDAAAFSFYPTKNLGALGDGGMVLTNDPEIAAQARLLREYGWKERYISFIEGGNSRLDPLQAAILSVGLERLDQRNDQRRAVAAIYDEILDSSPILRPGTSAGTRHVYHQYVIRLPGRDALAAHLAAEKVGAAIHYPQPVHRQPAYAGRFGAEDLPHTDQVTGEILSLPMYPQLALDDARRIASLIHSYAGRAG